jgi:hypothetical protein
LCGTFIAPLNVLASARSALNPDAQNGGGFMSKVSEDNPTVQIIADLMHSLFRQNRNHLYLKDAVSEIEQRFGPTPLAKQLGDSSNLPFIEPAVAAEFEKRVGDGLQCDEKCGLWFIPPDDPGPDYPPPLPMEPLKGH